MFRAVLVATLALVLAGCPKADVIGADAGFSPLDTGFVDELPKVTDFDVPAVDLPDPPDLPAVPDVQSRDVGPPRTLVCGANARIDDPTGDTVVLGNEAGGRFTLVLDVAVTNVGVIAREPVDLTLNGDFAHGVRVVHFVGEGAAASTLYAPPEVALERGGTPASPFNDVTGSITMTCGNDCSPGIVAGDHGCNSAAQITTYFERRFGTGRRMIHLQTSSFDGLYVFASRGGCCLP